MYRPHTIAPPSTVTLEPDSPANRALLAAVRAADVAAVQEAFAAGAAPSVREVLVYHFPPEQGGLRTHITPLLAMLGGADEKKKPDAAAIFRLFVERGADMGMTGAQGDTAVGWAVTLNDLELVRLVLDNGADVQAVYSNSPLSGGNIVNILVATSLRGREEGTLPFLALVLERGADPNRQDDTGMTPLHSAARRALAGSVELLLKHGADPTLLTKPMRYHRTGVAGETALTLAQRGGDPEVIRLLRAAQNDPTPVEAATVGDVAALERHLAAGADPNGTDSLGIPLLYLAAASGNAVAVRLLLANGADPNASNPDGSTALHRAAVRGFTDAVGALLDAGADPNAAGGRAEYLETALTLAVEQAHADVVALLLDRGADVAAPGNRDALARLADNAGSLPRRLPGHPPDSRRDRGEVIAQQNRIYGLLVARMDIPAMGGKALLRAIEMRLLVIARDLIERGADVNACGPSGDSVLMTTISVIGVIRAVVSPEILRLQCLNASEKAERRAGAADAGAEAMEFLRFLLDQKPDLDYRKQEEGSGRAGSADERQGTALEMAHSWRLRDVAVLLKQAGATR